MRQGKKEDWKKAMRKVIRSKISTLSVADFCYQSANVVFSEIFSYIKLCFQ